MPNDLPLPPSALDLDVDKDALIANWTLMNRLSGAAPGQARAGAAVKADAYGLGAVRVAALLWGAGCRMFFVAHWQEAAALLGVVPAEAIAVLHGPRNGAEADFAVASGVVPVINSALQARVWRDAGGGLCHLMIDTGMSRLGVSEAEMTDEAVRGLDIDLLLSHLASADEDTPQNARQLALWQAARGQVAHRRASLANSAGIALGGAYLGDLTRPGLALYGGVPRGELAGLIRQVAFPQAAVLQVRHVSAGTALGYNATFVAPRPMRIGTIALGYADGYLRCWSGVGAMRGPGGEALPVLGRVSMDLTIIDLSDAPAVAEGDLVRACYDLPGAAAASGLSQYELLTLLGRRFSRTK